MKFYFQIQSFVYWVVVCFHYVWIFHQYVDTIKISTYIIKEYEFRRDVNAAQTAGNIYDLQSGLYKWTHDSFIDLNASWKFWFWILIVTCGAKLILFW